MAHHGPKYASPPPYEYGNGDVPRGRGGTRDDYYNESYDDHRGRGRDRGHHDQYNNGYYSDDYHDRRPERPGPNRRKSTLQKAIQLGKAGATALLANNAVSGGRSRSRGRHHGGYDDYDDRGYGRSRSRGRNGGRSHSIPRTTQQKWQQAVQAAVMAGAVEAYRSRKEPGSWRGEKGQRVLTAAIGAAGIDGVVDKNPRRNSKRHLAEAVIGGLAANRVANGPRSRSRSRTPFGKSRSASRGRDGRSRSLSDILRGR